MAYRIPAQVFGNVGQRPDWVAVPLAVTGTNTYNSTQVIQAPTTIVAPNHVMDAVGNAAMFSYQVGVVSGTPTGTFNVYVSDDPRAADPYQFANAIWTLVQSVAFTTGTAPGGSASAFINVQNGARFSYASWVNSAGSGTILGFGTTIGNAGA